MYGERANAWRFYTQYVVYVEASAIEPNLALDSRVSACQFEIKGRRGTGARWNNNLKDFSRVRSLFENVSHGTRGLIVFRACLHLAQRLARLPVRPGTDA